MRDALASPEAGLDAAVAAARRVEHGDNPAVALGPRPLWLQFLDRFRNPAAARAADRASGLSALTGDIASFVIG